MVSHSRPHSKPWLCIVLLLLSAAPSSATAATAATVAMAAIEAPTAFEACWLDGVGAHFRWEEASAAARYRLYIQSSIIAETRFAARFVEMATIEDILSARVTSVDFDGRESGPSLAPEWFDCGSGIPPHAFEPQRDRF